MDLNNKIDDLINKLNKKNFFEVIKEGKKLIKKFQNLFIFYNIVGLAHQNIKNFESENFPKSHRNGSKRSFTKK